MTCLAWDCALSNVLWTRYTVDKKHNNSDTYESTVHNDSSSLLLFKFSFDAALNQGTSTLVPFQVLKEILRRNTHSKNNEDAKFRVVEIWMRKKGDSLVEEEALALISLIDFSKMNVDFITYYLASEKLTPGWGFTNNITLAIKTGKEQGHLCFLGCVRMPYKLGSKRACSFW